MTMQLKVTKVGNSLGILLPKEAASRLNVEAGDTVFITDSPDGFRITGDNPEFAKQMQIASKVMKKYRNTLRELAK
jgi:putative addiction module antidote